MATYFHIRRIGKLNADKFLRIGDILQFEEINIYSRYLWQESLLTTAGRVHSTILVMEKLPEKGQDQLRAAMNSRLCKQVVEYVFETVRLRCFPNKPSRKTCIFASNTIESITSWIQNFGKSEKYQILEIELEPTALTFDGDANLVCYDTLPLNMIEKYAYHYWNGAKSRQPLEEVLIHGSARVICVIESIGE